MRKQNIWRRKHRQQVWEWDLIGYGKETTHVLKRMEFGVADDNFCGGSYVQG